MSTGKQKVSTATYGRENKRVRERERERGIETGEDVEGIIERRERS